MLSHSFLLDNSIKLKIVQAASIQFFRYGYTAISMDSISDSLGMSKKTLYTIFTGKYDLLVHVIELFKKELSGEVDTILNDEKIEFPEKMKQMMLCIGNTLSKISPDFIADVQEHVPEIWESLQHYKMEAGYLRFNKLVNEGIQKGFIKKEINKSVAVAMYASAIQSLLDDRFLVQLPDSIRKDIPKHPSVTFDAIATILFSGIMKSTINEPAIALQN